MKHEKIMVLKGFVFRHFFFLIRKIVTTRDWLVVAGLMLLCIIYLFLYLKKSSLGILASEPASKI
jgi:hypothetical protein